jgi:hypothetical protein
MGNQFVPLFVAAKPATLVFRPGAGVQNPDSKEAGLAHVASGAPAPASLEPALPNASCSASSSAPEVTFKRDGDHITQIQIRCSCGESMILDCDYGANPQTQL